MKDQTTEFQASASHISLMHRTYGPRMHMDENAASAPADSGSEVAAAPISAEEGFSPEQALESLLNKRKKSQSPAEGAADDGATAETELSAEDNADPQTADHGEAEEADAEAEKLPPIERPKSWSKDEDAEWEAIPRARQEKIVANELARDADRSRKLNEAAEKVKAADAKIAQAEQAKQTYEAKLPALMQALHNINNTAFSDIRSQDDVTLLAQVDPPRWVLWREHQDRMVQANHELQQAESGKAAKQQSEWQEYRDKEDALASEKIPDLADKVKGPKLMERAGAKLAELGFKPEELRGLVTGQVKIAVVDHRFQQLLKDSLDLADIRAAAKRTVPIVKTVPPVQRPGNATPNRGAQDIATLRTKASNSGDVNDAFALYLAKKSRRA